MSVASDYELHIVGRCDFNFFNGQMFMLVVYFDESACVGTCLCYIFDVKRPFVSRMGEHIYVIAVLPVIIKGIQYHGRILYLQDYALILVPAIRLARRGNKTWWMWALTILTIALVAFLKFSPLWIIIAVMALSAGVTLLAEGKKR